MTPLCRAASWALAGLLAFAVASVPAARAAEKEPAVEIQVAKLADLNAVIAKHKGKIVLVDCWATFCIPCMEEFPNLVQLHKEYGTKGLVCISVSFDDPDDKAKALKFLQKQKASFTNLLLNESPETVETKLGFKALPAAFIYGRDGKLAKKFLSDGPKNQFTYKDVRKVLEPMLKAE